MYKRQGIDPSHVIMSGDHLGPFTMQDKNEDEAMEYSRELVRQYVEAGFRKIHLDTSMRLADDPQDRPLATEVSTRRAVEPVSYTHLLEYQAFAESYRPTRAS